MNRTDLEIDIRWSERELARYEEQATSPYGTAKGLAAIMVDYYRDQITKLKAQLAELTQGAPMKW